MWYLLPLLCGALELEIEPEAPLTCNPVVCNSTATLGQPCKTETGSGTIELSPCTSPYYCSLSKGNSTCDYWPPYSETSFPGEPCNTDSQCYYGFCGGGNICVGKTFN